LTFPEYYVILYINEIGGELVEYKFVDIGTSYFCTSIDEYGLDVQGILVEPVKSYLNEIPNSPTIIKANYAISDKTEIGILFISKNDGPIRYYSKKDLMASPNKAQIGTTGINSLNSFKGSGTGIPISCEVITFHDLCEKYDITRIEQLKIDTEGNEHLILPQVFDRIFSNELEVSKIIYEYNRFSNKRKLDAIKNKFISLLGYTDRLEKNIWDEEDIILEMEEES
jgi:FkbM family methyltransferase